MVGKAEKVIEELVAEKKPTLNDTTLALSGLIFSCDRAMQLDGTLRSFFLHCKDSETIHLDVLYLATSGFHAQQYAQLAQEYASSGRVRFLPQKRFQEDTLGLLAFGVGSRDMGTRQYLSLKLLGVLRLLGWTLSAQSTLRDVLFLVDDNIFVDDFSLRETGMALASHPEAIGFSLRLGKNTTYCYSLDQPQMLPEFKPLDEHMLKFDWTTGKCDFGYPLEVSSSIYRLRDILPLLNRLRFENPNVLEGRMAACAHPFRTKNPYLLCYEQSVTFCNPINKIQSIYANRAGTKLEYTGQRLAQMFEMGYRIKAEAYKDFVPNACHQEIEMIFTEHPKVSLNDTL